jgi:hypothetical protein
MSSDNNKSFGISKVLKNIEKEKEKIKKKEHFNIKKIEKICKNYHIYCMLSNGHFKSRL